MIAEKLCELRLFVAFRASEATTTVLIYYLYHVNNKRCNKVNNTYKLVIFRMTCMHSAVCWPHIYAREAQMSLYFLLINQSIVLFQAVYGKNYKKSCWPQNFHCITFFTNYAEEI